MVDQGITTLSCWEWRAVALLSIAEAWYKPVRVGKVTMNELDIRELPPRERHPLIFSSLDSLSTGETLRLINDHDPVPFRYQLDAERPGHFDWQSVEEGPERWVIDITSRAHIFDARSIIAAGGEPFGAIMAAISKVSEGEVLVLKAPFDPVPLKGVLAEHGFTASTRETAEGWVVTFSRAG